MRISVSGSTVAWRNALLGIVCAVSVSACYVYARPAPGVAVVVAPPAPQEVAEPAPRTGYVWTAGYWSWNGNQYVWIRGRWRAERPGYHWVRANYVQVNGGWQFVRGHWEPNA